MSGVVSGIGKVFTSVASGVAKVGKAVLGVGATLFTGGAAAGAGSMASGGLSGLMQSLTGSGGVLGNILNGAMKIAGYGGAALGVPGAGSLGGLFSSAGLTPAATATGLSATGTTMGGGLFDFLKSETGGALIGGVGEGLMAKAKMDWESDEAQKNRDYLRGKEDRLTRSYDVAPSALPGAQSASPAAAPAIQAQATPVAAVPNVPVPKPAEKFRYEYDPSKRNVVRVPG